MGETKVKRITLTCIRYVDILIWICWQSMKSLDTLAGNKFLGLTDRASNCLTLHVYTRNWSLGIACDYITSNTGLALIVSELSVSFENTKNFNKLQLVHIFAYHKRLNTGGVEGLRTGLSWCLCLRQVQTVLKRPSLCWRYMHSIMSSKPKHHHRECTCITYHSSLAKASFPGTHALVTTGSKAYVTMQPAKCNWNIPDWPIKAWKLHKKT